jgi:hypothetical protein
MPAMAPVLILLLPLPMPLPLEVPLSNEAGAPVLEEV